VRPPRFPLPLGLALTTLRPGCHDSRSILRIDQNPACRSLSQHAEDDRSPAATNDPLAWCVCHHLLHWADGGHTSLGNLVLLCGRHHTVIHHGDWAARLGADGRPEFIPPAWIDPNAAYLGCLVRELDFGGAFVLGFSVVGPFDEFVSYLPSFDHARVAA
jgi:hypothetical protein